jgi:hypothetical protein
LATQVSWWVDSREALAAVPVAWREAAVVETEVVAVA